MAAAFGNSMAVTVPAVVIPIVIAGFTAYGFTFMTFPGRRILFAIVVALLVVPVQVALAPLLRLYSDLGLNGTYAAVYLAHIGFGLPLGVLLLRNFMATLPRTIIEAARIALVFLGEGDRQTVRMALGGQIGQAGGRGWQAVSGAALLAISVPVLVFIVLQRYFVRGLISGAVQG
jgi:alpha-glucoside transport system permease protein